MCRPGLEGLRTMLGLGRAKYPGFVLDLRVEGQMEICNLKTSKV